MMEKLLLIVLAAIAITAAMLLADSGVDQMSQRTFPCQEDEVLGYSPKFGPDQVGCIHVEDLKG